MKKTLLSAVLLTFGYANSQTFVNTNPENKKVILEEFTGVNCVFCPQGHTGACGSGLAQGLERGGQRCGGARCA